MKRNVLSIVETWIWEKWVVSKRPVPIAKWHGVVKHVTEGQQERILLRERKNV